MDFNLIKYLWLKREYLPINDYPDIVNGVELCLKLINYSKYSIGLLWENYNSYDNTTIGNAEYYRMEGFSGIEKEAILESYTKIHPHIDFTITDNSDFFISKFLNYNNKYHFDYKEIESLEDDNTKVFYEKDIKTLRIIKTDRLISGDYLKDIIFLFKENEDIFNLLKDLPKRHTLKNISSHLLYDLVYNNLSEDEFMERLYQTLLGEEDRRVNDLIKENKNRISQLFNKDLRLKQDLLNSLGNFLEYKDLLSRKLSSINKKLEEIKTEYQKPYDETDNVTKFFNAVKDCPFARIEDINESIVIGIQTKFKIWSVESAKLILGNRNSFLREKLSRTSSEFVALMTDILLRKKYDIKCYGFFKLSLNDNNIYGTNYNCNTIGVPNSHIVHYDCFSSAKAELKEYLKTNQYDLFMATLLATTQSITIEDNTVMVRIIDNIYDKYNNNDKIFVDKKTKIEYSKSDLIKLPEYSTDINIDYKSTILKDLGD